MSDTIALRAAPLEEPTHTPVFLWAYCNAGDDVTVYFTGPWASEAMANQYPPKGTASRRLFQIDLPHHALRPTL